jgi:hypothetical protein
VSGKIYRWIYVHRRFSMTVGTHGHTFRFNSETDVRRPLTEMTRYILPLTGYSASKSNHYFCFPKYDVVRKQICTLYLIVDVAHSLI